MIYVASSWRNPAFEGVIDCLDQWGLDYYNFKTAKGGFHWSEVMPDYKEANVTTQQFFAALQQERSKEGFGYDMGALQQATSVLMVLPCGRSAHTEMGWACGRKPVCIYFPASYRINIEPELMYLMANKITDDIDECMKYMKSVEPMSDSEREAAERDEPPGPGYWEAGDL